MFVVLIFCFFIFFCRLIRACVLLCVCLCVCVTLCVCARTREFTAKKKKAKKGKSMGNLLGFFVLIYCPVASIQDIFPRRCPPPPLSSRGGVCHECLQSSHPIRKSFG